MSIAIIGKTNISLHVAEELTPDLFICSSGVPQRPECTKFLYR